MCLISKKRPMFSSSSASMSHLVARRSPKRLPKSRAVYVPAGYNNGKVRVSAQCLSSARVRTRHSRELDKDREELSYAAGFARNASSRACSDPFWKNLECYFASVTSQNESYLKHQLDFADAVGSFYQISEDEKDVLQNDEVPTLYQRLISALIDTDESKGISHNRDRMASPISSPSCNYHTLSVEDKIKEQLQSIDLCPKMHQIAEGEDAINKDIIELEARLVQQVQKKRRYVRKIYESIQHEKDAEKRNLEQAAMSELIEMAYRRTRVSRESCSSDKTLRKVSKKAALPFVKRTLARCQEFEDTGRSCFEKPALQPKGSGSRGKQQYMEMNRDMLPNDFARRNEEPRNVGKNRENPQTKQPMDGMQDQDWQGLAIPMDDLSDVYFGPC